MSILKQIWLLFIAIILFITIAPFVFLINIFRFIHKDYLLNVAIGIDQLGGSLLYNEQDYTISSYTFYLCKFEKRFCWFEKFINFLFGKEHCQKSFKDEQKQIIKEARL